jgi:hypothetical protein
MNQDPYEKDLNPQNSETHITWDFWDYPQES